MNYFQKLKHKWDITSNLSLILIMVVFSVAGMGAVRLANLVYYLFGFTKETPLYVKIPVRILFIFPSYQIMLLIFGFIFGQFKFFWEKEKKLVQWLGRILGINKP